MSTELAMIELDHESERRLDDCAFNISQCKLAMAWKLIEIGRELSKAREIYGPYNAEFLRWAQETCGISRTRCYECIQAFEKFGLSTKLDGFAVSAIVMLSRDSVPDEARQAAIEAAAFGEHINTTKAQELIREHRVRVVHDEHGEPDDGRNTSTGSTNHAPARVSGLAAESSGGDGFAVDGGSRGSNEGSQSEQDGCLDCEPGETVHADRALQAETDHGPHKGKAAKAESNVINDASRQIIAEAEFATENLADYQVLAIYERVRVWFAQDLKRRGIKP